MSEPIRECLEDLIDTLHLHRGDEVGSYTMINTGEMEQAIERARICLARTLPKQEDKGMVPLDEEKVYQSLVSTAQELWKINANMTAYTMLDAYTKTICSKFARPATPVEIRINREKLAKEIFKPYTRFRISKEEVDTTFDAHYTTWNPTVNEAFVIADAIITDLENIAEWTE